MAFIVATAFERFCKNLRFSDDNLSKIRNRYHSIAKRINIDYWETSSDSTHSLYVGSYGRDTEIFTSDIDMLVQLPYSTYEKFNAYSTNGQSALLQEVKKVIEKTYSITKLKADGQIISIVKDAVQRTQQGSVFLKILAPESRVLVAGEDHIETAFFVVSPVNQVKEQPGIAIPVIMM